MSKMLTASLEKSLRMNFFPNASCKSLLYLTHCSNNFGSQPFIVQALPLLIYILRVDNTFELYLLGTDPQKVVNKFSNLLAKYKEGKLIFP